MAFTILLMLGLLALAHGTLVASLGELAGSRAAARDLEARAAAERGIQTILAAAPGSWWDSLDLGEARTRRLESLGGMDVLGTARRLGPESWLIGGAGRLGNGEEARTMRLAWSLDPVARVAELRAIVTVAPGALATLGGAIDSDSPASVLPPMQAGDCEPWLATLVARQAGEPLPVVASAPDTLGFPGLGLLDFDGLMASAPDSVSGVGTPAPAEALGVCLTDEPWNWGDPEEPSQPCGPHLPLRAAVENLQVSGGAGQGVLLVDGDLMFRDGARYFGIVMVRGMLRLEEGSTFEGMALAGGGIRVAPGATLRGSTCWAVRALAAQRELLGQLVPVVSAGRIGPL